MAQSWASSEATRKSMRGNRGKDTAPELAVRRELHRRGLRYRVGVAPVEGVRRSVDIVFPRQRLAILIDGCFWHGCPEHCRTPHTHMDYWGPKLAHNKERDQQTDELLAKAGWEVLRFWEHEPSRAVADAIEARVKTLRGQAGPGG